MSDCPIFYAKNSHIDQTTNADQVFEWWIYNDKRIIVQSKSEESQSSSQNYCYQYEIDNGDYAMLLKLTENDFLHVCHNEVNSFSWWEMHAYDANADLTNWFRGSNISGSTLQSLINILVKYVSCEEATKICNIHTSDNANFYRIVIPKNDTADNGSAIDCGEWGRILKICCNFLVIGLCLVGGVAYGKDFIWRAFSYDDSLTKFDIPLLLLTILLPVFYLLFFNSEGKNKNLFGITAAGLVFFRQVLCLVRTPDVSSLACLIGAGTFFFIFLITVSTKKQRSSISLIYMSIIPLVFSIVGIIEMNTGITHDYTLLAVISSIFIILCHLYLIICTSKAE